MYIYVYIYIYIYIFLSICFAFNYFSRATRSRLPFTLKSLLSPPVFSQEEIQELFKKRTSWFEILQHFTCPGWKNASLLRESSREPSNKTEEQGQSRGSDIESGDAERWGCASPKEIKEQLARAKSEFGRNLDSFFPYLFAPIAAFSFLHVLNVRAILAPGSLRFSFSFLYLSPFPRLNHPRILTSRSRHPGWYHLDLSTKRA